MVHDALGAGQHAVVVGHHRDRPALDRRGARDQAVGRRPRDQVVERAAAALRGDGQRAVFDEAARVDEIGDVLPGRAAPGGVAASGYFGSALVEPDPVPLPRLGQIGPDVFQGDGACLRPLGGIGAGFGQHDQHGSGRYGSAWGHQHLAYQAGGLGPQFVLHLHGLDDEQFVARRHLVAGRDRDRHDRARQRGGHRGVARWHLRGGRRRISGKYGAAGIGGCGVVIGG